MGSMWNIGEGLCTVIISLYYMYVSLDWSYLIWVVNGLYVCFAIAQIFLIIDSPKKLYAEKRYAECYDCMKYMGNFNGVTIQPLALKLISDKSVLGKKLV